jgi:hypothetical protein
MNLSIICKILNDLQNYMFAFLNKGLSLGNYSAPLAHE